MLDKKAFEEAKRKVIGIDRQRLGIGTLSEKTVHAILKHYYEPDEDRQEIPIENYVADICANGEIIEIQTRQFDKMRNKLSAFLPRYPVTIVYPIPREKWIIWIDEESGELSKKRKSPLKGNPYLIFPELYKIKMFLKHPNLRLRLVFLDMEEYKLLNGRSRDKKKGSMRYDRIPAALLDEIRINGREDYFGLIPEGLPERFTAKDFGEQIRERKEIAALVLNILHDLDVVERCGRSGRYYLYRISGTDF